MSQDPHEHFAKRFNHTQGCPECHRYTYYAPLRSRHNLFYMECEDHGWRWLVIPSWLHGYIPDVPGTYWHNPDYFKKNQRQRNAEHAHKYLTMEEWDQAESERLKAERELYLSKQKKSA